MRRKPSQTRRALRRGSQQELLYWKQRAWELAECRRTASTWNQQLYHWLQHQQSHVLSGDKLLVLRALDIPLPEPLSTADATWCRHLSSLIDWAVEHRSCCVPYRTPQLGPWLSKQRGAAAEGRLPDHRRQALLLLGVSLAPGRSCSAARRSCSKEDLWQRRWGQLQRFVAAHGHAHVPSRYPSNPSLGYWCVSQRRAAREGRLSEQRRAALQQLGFRLPHHEQQHHEQHHEQQ